ncbi:McrC family protein [Shewanella sp. YLB-07]|uniref:McrC family protein n=1 Tax=Shewanella sp. YLB-07 TaxID=2601268 RepID=UPI00128DE42E|nr:McrC family protein [Shewanella sp. YLB-07]MPY24526.1 restriction endonuclease [Shewanella sp. YLB-07]
MRAKKEITLFEFDCLVSDDNAARSGYDSSDYSHIQVVSNKAYEYLKSLCLSDESESKLLQLRRRRNMEVLQVQNYAGVIFTPDRTQIEVLPKVGKGFKGEGADNSESAYEKARKSLLVMLRALKGFSHIQTSSANIASQKMPLLEVFISQFLKSVNVLVKRGLRSDYVRREDNLAFLKGKLNVGKQVKRNYINKHKFYCEYDEFLLDRPANRLLHSALLKVKTISRTAVNQKLLQELEFVFNEVPQSSDYKSDFTKVKLDRGMSYYQVPLAWCKLILEGLSPQSMKGDSHAVSLLFPMEKVFEDYVAKVLKEQLAVTHPELTISSQVTGEYLASYDGRDKFSLRPDLVVKQGKSNQIVLDTKWKLLDTKLSNSNISQSDIYQLFAYAKKYLADTNAGKDVVLIYPSQDNFNEPLLSPFKLGDRHRLWVVPFEIINTDDTVGIRWPCMAKESNTVSIRIKAIE